MEFNANQHYHHQAPGEAHVSQIMYPYSGYPLQTTQPQSYPHTTTPSQITGNWALPTLGPVAYNNLPSPAVKVESTRTTPTQHQQQQLPPQPKTPTVPQHQRTPPQQTSAEPLPQSQAQHYQHQHQHQQHQNRPPSQQQPQNQHQISHQVHHHHQQYNTQPISTSMPTPPATAITSHAYQQVGLQPGCFNGVTINSGWGHKDDSKFPDFEPDLDFSQSLMAHDENAPIIDLRQYGGLPSENDASNFNTCSSRRLSESSYSIASTAVIGEHPTAHEEFTYSDPVTTYASECEPWPALEHPPSLLSPNNSPRRPPPDHLVQRGSRARASPAPHHNVRASPYTIDSTRLKRWSAPTSTPAGSRNITQLHDRYATYSAKRPNPHHSMPAYPQNYFANMQMPPQNVLFSQPHPLQSNHPSLFAAPDQPYKLEVPRPLPSQGLFRLFQSSNDRHGGCSSHFADLSDPPDLYSSLNVEPSDPPESDMNPSDPDLVPHEQDLRFTGDLYTPRWVRGHGNKREGWCGLCKPGRWLVLKNSAFWYDKSFTHGVSAATGAAFQGPQEKRRTEGNLDVWEGLCGSCGEWIPLVSSKKKGTTWFRHAYKCHTHPKVKDGPKRRRETSHQMRARAISNASQASQSALKEQQALESSRDAGAASQSRPSNPNPSSAGLNTLNTDTGSSQLLEMPKTEPDSSPLCNTQPLTPHGPSTPYSHSHLPQPVTLPHVQMTPPHLRPNTHHQVHPGTQHGGTIVGFGGGYPGNPLGSLVGMI